MHDEGRMCAHAAFACEFVGGYLLSISLACFKPCSIIP